MIRSGISEEVLIQIKALNFEFLELFRSEVGELGTFERVLLSSTLGS